MLNDIQQFKTNRDQHTGLDSVDLANDLFDCQSAKELSLRLGQADIPKKVRNELKAKLNKVK